MRGDAPRHTAGGRAQPQIAAITENELVLVNVRKAHQAAFGRLLRNHSETEQSKQIASHFTRRYIHPPPLGRYER